MSASSKLYVRDGNRITMPRHIWIDEVLQMADVSNADMEHYVGRARLNGWYNDEMPVWMAASSVRDFVKLGRKAEQIEDREHGYRRVIAGVRRRS